MAIKSNVKSMFENARKSARSSLNQAQSTLLDATKKAQSTFNTVAGNAQTRANEFVDKAAEYGVTITGPNAKPAPKTGHALFSKTPGIPDSMEVPELVRQGNAPSLKSPNQVGDFDIEKSGILQEAEGAVSDLLSGNLPEDVIEEIIETSAEQNLQTGVFGQSADFQTAAALGQTSLDMVLKGIEASTALGQVDQQRILAEADLNARVDMSNAQMQLEFEKLKEQTRQWEDKVVFSLQELELGWQAANLAVFDLISTNQRHMQTLINEMVVNNARYDIAGINESIQALGDFFNTSNEAILAAAGFIKR